MSFTSINPANNQTLRQYSQHSKTDLGDAIEAADRSYRSWRTTTFDDRKQCLLALADELRSDAKNLAELITLEMGKRIAESRYEIEYCAKIAEFYANGAEHFLADQTMHVKNTNAYLRHEPIGVLLGVMPWNFPFYQVIRFAAPNIMAGNAVIVKHAQNVPQCAEKIEQLISRCGLPKGVYTNLFIPTDLVESIIADHRVQGVSLTGSEAAGEAVGALAGRHLKRSVLELGGNDPFIVLHDADIDDAVKKAVQGRVVNAGQSCVASKRFIVTESVAEPFIEGFKTQLSRLRCGDPMDPDTTLSPLSTEAAATGLLEKVRASIDAGARVLLGGDRPNRDGAFFNPTMLTNLEPSNPAFDQELFGPVAAIHVVKDESAAIELANHSSYGLGASVYTTDLERGRRVAEQIESGMVFLNQPTKSQAELPFGGIKHSGYGRELSELGILEFVNKKLIHLGR